MLSNVADDDLVIDRAFQGHLGAQRYAITFGDGQWDNFEHDVVVVRADSVSDAQDIAIDGDRRAIGQSIELTINRRVRINVIDDHEVIHQPRRVSHRDVEHRSAKCHRATAAEDPQLIVLRAGSGAVKFDRQRVGRLKDNVAIDDQLARRLAGRNVAVEGDRRSGDVCPRAVVDRAADDCDRVEEGRGVDVDRARAGSGCVADGDRSETGLQQGECCIGEIQITGAATETDRRYRGQWLNC